MHYSLEQLAITAYLLEELPPLNPGLGFDRPDDDLCRIHVCVAGDHFVKLSICTLLVSGDVMVWTGGPRLLTQLECVDLADPNLLANLTAIIGKLVARHRAKFVQLSPIPLMGSSLTGTSGQ